MTDVVIPERTAANVLHGLDAARRAGWAKFYAERDRADHLEAQLEQTEQPLRRCPEWDHYPEWHDDRDDWPDDDPKWVAYLDACMAYRVRRAECYALRRVMLSAPPRRDETLARIRSIRNSLRAGVPAS